MLRGQLTSSSRPPYLFCAGVLRVPAFEAHSTSTGGTAFPSGPSLSRPETAVGARLRSPGLLPPRVCFSRLTCVPTEPPATAPLYATGGFTFLLLAPDRDEVPGFLASLGARLPDLEDESAAGLPLLIPEGWLHWV